MALGNRTSADAQLELAFTHMEPHFGVFAERNDGWGEGAQHFITGSGEGVNCAGSLICVHS